MRRKLKTLLVIALSAALIVTAAGQAAAAGSGARKVRISRSRVSIVVGQKVRLKVTGTKKKVRWSSSDKSVATVKAGKVKGRKKGVAFITARVKGKTLKCRVKVKPVLEVSPRTLNIRGSGTLKVTLRKYAAVNCFIADSSVATGSWGSWRTLKNGSYQVTLTITGKQKGATKVILTNSYNKEAPEIRVNVLKAKS